MLSDANSLIGKSRVFQGGSVIRNNTFSFRKITCNCWIHSCRLDPSSFNLRKSMGKVQGLVEVLLTEGGGCPWF